MAGRDGLITSGRLLALGLFVAFVCSFLPVRFLGFASDVSGVAVRLVAPIGDAGKFIGDWFSRSETAEHPAPEIGRVQELESLVRRKELEIGDLRQRLSDLEGGRDLLPAGLTQLSGRVFSRSADRTGSGMFVRRGSDDGVTLGTVATVRGAHMLGQVSQVEGSFCVVTPITDRVASPIEVEVRPADAGVTATAVRFIIEPDGDGLLRGPGEFVTTGADQRPVQVQPGDVATLSDPAMSSHWGLIVGEVVEVDADENSPLRQVIAVRPRVDTRHVASVILRIPADPEADAPAGERGP